MGERSLSEQARGQNFKFKRRSHQRKSSTRIFKGRDKSGKRRSSSFLSLVLTFKAQLESQLFKKNALKIFTTLELLSKYGFNWCWSLKTRTDSNRRYLRPIWNHKRQSPINHVYSFGRTSDRSFFSHRFSRCCRRGTLTKRQHLWRQRRRSLTQPL